MMEEDTYELFESKTTKEVYEAFVKTFEISQNKKAGKLTDLQKDVLTRVSLGESYGKIMKALDKKDIGSIQSPLRGGVKNILDAVKDIVWLYNNPILMRWVEVNGDRFVK